MNFEQLVILCQRTHEDILARASRTVDAHLVIRNWILGQYIAEFEQSGADRAEYGTRLLEKLSERLKPLKIKGTSTTRLKLYRSFYRLFPIRPTASDLSHSSGLPRTRNFLTEIVNAFPLGWFHYVELLTIDSAEERCFHEIEAAAKQWSVRELQRQIASSLYERLALSRDKQEIGAPPRSDARLRSLQDRFLRVTGVRGDRSARPPANRWHPSGMASFEPGGFKAISRWSRRDAPTPPDPRPRWIRIPEGCQPMPSHPIPRDLEGGQP